MSCWLRRWVIIRRWADCVRALDFVSLTHHKLNLLFFKILKVYYKLNLLILVYFPSPRFHNLWFIHEEKVARFPCSANFHYNKKNTTTTTTFPSGELFPRLTRFSCRTIALGVIGPYSFVLQSQGYCKLYSNLEALSSFTLVQQGWS